MLRSALRFAVSILIVVAGWACGSDDAGSPDLMLSRSETTWTDTSRNLPRTPEREIRVVLWDPGASGRLPLLVLAHGFGGLPEKFEAFARTLAAAGFIVAAPAFPLTNENALGGHERGLVDTVNQPGDISFVLDRILAANGEREHPLSSRIDSKRIALLGHSLGGLTALAATLKDCCLEARVRVLILAAPFPDIGSQFGPGFVATSLPTLLIHGEADPVIAFQTSLDLYDRLAAPKILVGLAGVGHSEALESQIVPAAPARRAAETVTIAFLRASFGGRTSELDAALDTLAVEGHRIERAR